VETVGSRIQTADNTLALLDVILSESAGKREVGELREAFGTFLEKRRDVDGVDVVSVADFKSITQFFSQYGSTGRGLQLAVRDASKDDDDEGGWCILVDDFMEGLVEIEKVGAKVGKIAMQR
jgi:hypothetical protein